MKTVQKLCERCGIESTIGFKHRLCSACEIVVLGQILDDEFAKEKELEHQFNGSYFESERELIAQMNDDDYLIPEMEE